MAKSKFRLNSKQFFTLTVLSVLALGLITVTIAVQKPTNTKSNASGACSYVPQYRLIDSVDYPNSVQYILRARNVNYESGCEDIMQSYYLKTTNKPNSEWRFEYLINGISVRNDEGLLYPPGNYDKIKLKVTPPPGTRVGTYYFISKVCKIGQYSDGTPKYTDNCNEVNLKYVKTPPATPTRPYNF
jgi:hypothetical protein